MQTTVKIENRYETNMALVTISSKFQVVIPKQIREGLKLRPGQKVQMLQYEGRIVIIPIPPIESARGLLRGIDTTVEREVDRV
jgi:AbrB family looped-hinge helix DNA binding protein